MQYAPHRRILFSLTLLVGLVLAYGLQAWHEYALHHHDHCCEDPGGQPASGEEDCTLCDYVFFFDLPESAPDLSVSVQQGQSSLAILTPDSPVPASRLTLSLRGPPAA